MKTGTANEILNKAISVIDLIDRDYLEFSTEHSDKLVSHNGREVDGAWYEIPLSKDYILRVRTEDFSLSRFSIDCISKD
jgi:hypothetical protein